MPDLRHVRVRMQRIFNVTHEWLLVLHRKVSGLGGTDCKQNADSLLSIQAKSSLQ